jgi:histidyl-tRNA synthetase
MGISCETDHMQRSFKAQFKYADKINAKYVIALGDNELETGKVTVKKMQDFTATTIDLIDIYNYNFE